MSKRTFVIFGVLAACLAVLLPFLAFRSEGEEQAGPASVQTGRELFQTNCGTCHTMAAAGTEGNFGPNLDILLYPQGPPPDLQTAKATATERVLPAIENGVDTPQIPGRMPGGILTGLQARQVAEFVAREGGE